MILDAHDVAALRRHYAGTGRIEDACDTIEYLREQLEWAAERIWEQSELLSKRAEKEHE